MQNLLKTGRAFLLLCVYCLSFLCSGRHFQTFYCLHFGLKTMVKPLFCPRSPMFSKSLNIPPANAHLCMSISSSLSSCTLGLKTVVLLFLILQKTLFLFQRGHAQVLETVEPTSQPQSGSCTTHPIKNLIHPSEVACNVYRSWLHLKQFIFVLAR